MTRKTAGLTANGTFTTRCHSQLNADVRAVYLQSDEDRSCAGKIWNEQLPKC